MSHIGFVLIFLLTNLMVGSAQGFYNHNSIFINPNQILENQISSINASDNHLDSTYHPMSNFVFEYTFANKGFITSHKYWKTNLDRNEKWLFVQLVKDTFIIDRNNDKIKYRTNYKTDVVKFNQDKQRDQKYIKKIFSKLENLKKGNTQTLFNNYIISGQLDWNTDFCIDTVILSKNVTIPRWLMPNGDSTIFNKNHMETYQKTDTVVTKEIYSLTPENEIKIEHYLNEKLWRTYLLNSEGRLVEEKQNIYKAVYYYDSKGLHIKTEEYNGEFLMGTTTFYYKNYMN